MLVEFVMIFGFDKLADIDNELELTAAGFGKICCGALLCLMLPAMELVVLAWTLL